MSRGNLFIISVLMLMPFKFFAQGFNDREVLDIRAKALLLTQEYEQQLNSISSTLWFDTEITLMIDKMISGNNRIFYSPQVIIEDDVDPRNHSENQYKNDLEVKRYLNSLHLFYAKTEMPTINFSDVVLSEIERKNYPYILVKYNSSFTGTHKQINYAYRPSERIIEYRIEKNGNNIALFITGIVFYNSSIEFQSAADIQVKSDISITEQLEELNEKRDSLARLEGRLDAEKALREKIEKEEQAKRREYETYLSNGENYLESGNLARLTEEPFLEFFDKAQQEFEKARNLFPNEIKPREYLGDIRNVKSEIQALEIKEKALKELEEGAGNTINIAREYYRLKYNDLVLDIHDKFPSKFPGEKWPNDIDIDKLIQLKNLMVPVTTKIETKDFIGALKDLNKKKKGLEEPWPELFYETANVYSIQKNYKKAMNDIDQAIALDPNYVDAYLLRGDIQLLADNTYEASVDYKYANRIDPNNISPNIKLANLYKRENKYDEAIDILIEAQKIDPTNPELPYQMGIIYMSKKYDDKPTPDIEKAREKFGNAIDLGNNEQNKPHASAYFELGKIKLTDGDFESASDDFKIARNIGLNNKQLDYLKEECEKQYFKGKKQVYYFKDNWHGIELFTNAINIYDELAAVWFQRGKAYYIEKKYDLAKIDFEKSIELYEEWDSAHYFLGMCLVSLDQNNDAIKQFDKASLYSSGKRMPVAEMGQGIAKYNLAQLVDVSDKETEKEFFGLLNDAGTHFASYLQLEDNALARFYYGQCLYQYTKYKEATVQFELAIKLDPGYGEAYYWKVRAMESKGGVKSAKAVEDLKFAVTNGFDSDTLYNKLAEYQTMDENDLKGAIRSYTKSLEYNKKQPLVYKERSAINARLGYYNNAAFDLLQAIKVDPTFGSFKIYATISRFYLRDKNLDSCILFADKSNALEENSDAFYSKACALMDKGERMLGLETLENALKLEDIPLDKIKKSSYFKDVVNTSEFKTLVNKYYSK